MLLSSCGYDREFSNDHLMLDLMNISFNHSLALVAIQDVSV